MSIYFQAVLQEENARYFSIACVRALNLISFLCFYIATVLGQGAKHTVKKAFLLMPLPNRRSNSGNKGTPLGREMHIHFQEMHKITRTDLKEVGGADWRDSHRSQRGHCHHQGCGCG